MNTHKKHGTKGEPLAASASTYYLRTRTIHDAFKIESPSTPFHLPTCLHPYICRMNALRIFLVVLLVTPLVFCAKAQDDNTVPDYTGQAPDFQWGFLIGLETGLFTGAEMPTEASLAKYENAFGRFGYGASLGMSMQRRINARWAFRPQALLSILTTRVKYEQYGFRHETHMIYPLTADILTHVIFNNPTETGRLGAHFGPAVEFNIPALDSPRQTSAPLSLRTDAGLSIPLNLGMGTFLLDISYGYSITDMISGSTLLDQWWGSNGRHRLGVRLHLY